MADVRRLDGSTDGEPTGEARRALVVKKETAFEMMSGEERERLAARKGLPDAHLWQEIVAADEVHRRTLERVREVLGERGWRFQEVGHAGFAGPEGHDVVISVGGDGTVLSASHRTIGVPLLGINSDPKRSVGYFCATGIEGVDAAIAALEDGTLRRFRLHRLRLEVDGQTAGPPVLNDVLVANENPAATSRYILIAGAREERQRSSGLWISTPAGSTAGIRSAGGAVLPLDVPLLQYLVREPVVSPLASYELLRGVRALEEGIVVVSQMEQGYAYIDGPYEKVPLPLGARMRISAHEPLVLLGLEPARRER
jgi:NAD+ kinase